MKILISKRKKIPNNKPRDEKKKVFRALLVDLKCEIDKFARSASARRPLSERPQQSILEIENQSLY